MKFKGDIIITDPCYIIKKDWRKCDYGDNMAALGLTNYISESTRYGDWSCSTPRKDVEAQLEELNASLNIEKIGYFCDDAVFLLDEVLKYNPDIVVF